MFGPRPLEAGIAAILLGLALLSSTPACGSDDTSYDFSVETKKPPRGRPYPCPEKPPRFGDVCSTRALSCEYNEGTCVCTTDALGMFGALAWNCPFEPEANRCPVTQPQAGTACASLLGASNCGYGRNASCNCSSEMQTWACWDPDDCPKDRPDDGAECGEPIGKSCVYSAATCECGSDGWSCAETK
jgi:hypothetical protein